MRLRRRHRAPEPRQTSTLSEQEAADVERARRIVLTIGAPRGGVLMTFGETGTIVDLPAAIEECSLLDGWGSVSSEETGDVEWLRAWLLALAERLGL